MGASGICTHVVDLRELEVQRVDVGLDLLGAAARGERWDGEGIIR